MSLTPSIAIAVFAFQVLYSKLWLTYFKFGPLEWLWRCLTYKKLFPLMKKDSKKISEIFRKIH
ncbi:DUF418 domain-containing protein [Salinimicrobium sp. CAU 1759]